VRAHQFRRKQAEMPTEKRSSGELLLPSGGILDGGTKGRRGRSSGAFIEGETWRRGRVFGGGSEIGRPGGVVVGRGSAQRWKEKLTGGARLSARREGAYL
jgi:hypothetical protein